MKLREIIYSGVLALGIATGVFSQDSIENKLTYMKDIPCAGRVEKHGPKEAKKTLVHVRQIHKTNSTQEGKLREKAAKHEGLTKLVEDSLQAANATATVCQMDIYEILDYLSQHGLQNVYQDGLMDSDDNSEALKRTLEAREKCLTAKARIELYAKNKERFRQVLSVEDFDKLERNYKIMQESLLKAEGELYLRGASEILAAERKIRLLPAEDKRIHDLASEVLKGETGDVERAKQYSNAREDFVLKRFSNSPDEVGCVVYGSAHDFRDNIDKWNQENPLNQISLVEITPKYITERDKK